MSKAAPSLTVQTKSMLSISQMVGVALRSSMSFWMSFSIDKNWPIPGSCALEIGPLTVSGQASRHPAPRADAARSLRRFSYSFSSSVNSSVLLMVWMMAVLIKELVLQRCNAPGMSILWMSRSWKVRGLRLQGIGGKAYRLDCQCVKTRSCCENVNRSHVKSASP